MLARLVLPLFLLGAGIEKASPQTQTARPATERSGDDANPFAHPKVLTGEQINAVASWTPQQWEAFMRPLLNAGEGRLRCRPALLIHVFIPEPYARLITDHSMICE